MLQHKTRTCSGTDDEPSEEHNIDPGLAEVSPKQGVPNNERILFILTMNIKTYFQS